MRESTADLFVSSVKNQAVFRKQRNYPAFL